MVPNIFQPIVTCQTPGVNPQEKIQLEVDSKESVCNARNPGSIPGSARSPGEGNGYLLQFLPGKFHGQRSLEGYRPWGCKELDMTERLSTSPILAYCFKRSYKVATN